MPIHNEENGLPILLESLISQTYTHFTIFIADNASTDASRDIVMEYSERDSRIRFVFYDEFVSSHASHKRAVQIALEKEVFDYIQFLGGDDSLSEVSYLQNLEGLLNSNFHLIFPKFKRSESSSFCNLNFTSARPQFWLYLKMCVTWDAVLTISAIYEKNFFVNIANKYLDRMQLPSDDWWFSFDILSHSPSLGFADNAVYYKNRKTIGYKTSYHLGNSTTGDAGTNSKSAATIQTLLDKTVIFPFKHHMQRRQFFKQHQKLWVPLGGALMSIRYLVTLLSSFISKGKSFLST